MTNLKQPPWFLVLVSDISSIAIKEYLRPSDEDQHHLKKAQPKQIANSNTTNAAY